MIASSEKERYQRYLCSREWAERRKLVLARSGGKCERCRAADASHVHHLTYARKYRELPEDLQALCEPCHEFIHGKRDDDPLRSVPPRLLGREIRSVYLAGKISGDAWREEILQPKRSDFWAVEDDNDEWFAPKLVPVPGSKFRLDYRGPFWIDQNGGHSSPGSNSGDHAYGDRLNHYQTNRSLVRLKSFKGVALSDLLFAWVDSPDCYGTLAELAFAYALGMKASNPPFIAVASPPGFDPEGMWFPLGMNQLRLTGYSSPRDAWESLWEWASS